MKYILYAVLLLAGRLQAQPLVEAPVNTLYTPAQLLQDFDTLYHWLHASHPELHFSVSKQTADKKWDEARKKLNAPMSRTDFMKLIVPLTTQYKDGHTAIYLDPWSQELKEYSNNGGTLFPAHLYIRDGRAWVKHHSAGQLKKGDELLSINNKPMAEIIHDMLPYWPADGKRSNENVVSRFFGITLWYLYGWGGNAEVQIRSKGRLQKIKLSGLQDSVLQHERSVMNPEWRLHIYETESLAVLESNTYNSKKKAEAFLDSAFTIIKAKGIRNVALDIRKNEGGNSAIGDMVLAYVTKKSFTPFKSKRILRENALAQHEDNKWVKQLISTAQKSWKVDESYYRLDLEPFRLDSLKKPELFFDGNFYLLTSGVTYSSAHMTAIEVKCFSLGTIIGEPTGERMNLSGEMSGMLLPNTKLPGSYAAAAYVTPCGDPRQVGVHPDILVPFNERDMQEGKDTVIEFLRKKVRGGKYRIGSLSKSEH
jgi:hypothetical protein